jgi:decaprenylphospho-beta-D-ribofuranose 2-oxidase
MSGNKLNLTSWGRTSYVSNAQIIDLNSFVLRSEFFQGGVIPIGLGRSYGDSRLNDKGVHLDFSSNTSITIDPHSQVAHCGSGASIGQLEKIALKYNLFPYASDIHGKSHFFRGSFSNWISSIRLLKSNSEVVDLYPEGETSDSFWATVGGMGLTGAIISAKIQLMKISSRFLLQYNQRVSSIDELFKLLVNLDEEYEYTVAWVDTSANRNNGRAIASAANHNNMITESDAEIKSSKPKSFCLPEIFPSTSINKFTTTFFNSLWFHKPINNGNIDLDHFFHPLDTIQNWNVLYGKKGFIQYQFVIPEKHVEFIKVFLRILKANSLTSPLTVLKRFGKSKSGLLSFPIEGWTISVDLPFYNNKCLKVLENLDLMVAELGGRVYLSKDFRLSRESFNRMYESHHDWIAVKKAMDPDNLWQSNQGRRLGLC